MFRFHPKGAGSPLGLEVSGSRLAGGSVPPLCPLRASLPQADSNTETAPGTGRPLEPEPCGVSEPRCLELGRRAAPGWQLASQTTRVPLGARCALRPWAEGRVAARVGGEGSGAQGCGKPR